jgi:mRNA-degrading endonuclease RelE of RelBE toxin-antitoxin system
MSKPVVCSPLTPSGMASTPTNVATIRYTDAFKRQLKRLSRRYRRIRNDVQPIIHRLQAGETPGTRVPGVDHILFKVRAPNTDASRGTSGGYRIIYYLTRADEVLLISIYSKSDQSDISRDELRGIIRGMDLTESDYQ